MCGGTPSLSSLDFEVHPKRKFSLMMEYVYVFMNNKDFKKINEL